MEIRTLRYVNNTQSNGITAQIQLLLGTEGNAQTGPDSPSLNTSFGAPLDVAPLVALSRDKS